MKTTTRKNLPAVNLRAADGESLAYALAPRGAQADVAYVDNQAPPQVIFANEAVPAADELKWNLKSSLDGNGKVLMTVPEFSYNRPPVDTGSQLAYDVSLGFVTAVEYTLTITHLKADGNQDTITDIDFTMEDPADEVDQVLQVFV